MTKRLKSATVTRGGKRKGAGRPTGTTRGPSTPAQIKRAARKKSAHAAGDKIAIEWTKGSKPDRFYPTRVIGLDGKIGPTQSRNDGSNCGTIYGSDTVLTADGLKRFSYSGNWSCNSNGSELLMIAEVADLNLADESLEDIERYTSRICSAITSAGSRVDATKAALARAEKLEALAALL